MNERVKINDDAVLADYSKKITTAWQQSVKAIIKTGELLNEAKAKVGHGNWERKLGTMDLPFGKRTAERLMAIADNSALTNPTNLSFLPASWNTLYKLSLIPEDEIQKGIEDELIHAGMTAAEADDLPYSHLFKAWDAIDRLLCIIDNDPEPEHLVKRLDHVPQSHAHAYIHRDKERSYCFRALADYFAGVATEQEAAEAEQ